MKICDRKDCQKKAAFYPVLLLRGHGTKDPAQLVFSEIGLCEEHVLTVMVGFRRARQNRLNDATP